MEMKDLLSLMWRKRLILLIGLILGIALGFAAVKLQTPIYEAKTQLLISRSRQPNNTDMLNLGEDQLVSTNVQLAKSQPVLDAVSAQLGSKVNIENIQVSALSNTLIIQIRVQDESPERAAVIANTLVQVLIRQNADIVSARYADFESSLNSQIAELQKQIGDLQGQINQINEKSISEQLAQVDQKIGQLNDEISDLSDDVNSYPSLLSEKQRIELNQKQSQLAQLRTTLNLYQQIQVNLTFIGKPGQTGVSRDDPRLNSLQSTLSLYQQLYLSLVDSRESINLDRMQNTPNITQIDPAAPPKDPVRPVPLFYIVVGIVVGLGLSITAILLLDHYDDTLRSSQSVQEVLGIPILGKISEAHREKADGGERRFTTRENSELLNAFGSLRINVNRLMLQQSVKTILITSPSRGDGKTMISLNLADAFAASGKKVALVDADLYRPRLHVRFGLDNKSGLTNILTGGLSWEEVTKSVRKITVITGGPATTNSAMLLESNVMDKFLADLQENFDVIILDSPPLFIMDAQILASKVGGILMVVRLGDTITAVARSMLDQLHLMDAHVLGAVLNCAPHQKDAGYFDGQVEKQRVKGLDEMDAKKAAIPIDPKQPSTPPAEGSS
jgi:polysaccharide biosynthesis transport protein